MEDGLIRFPHGVLQTVLVICFYVVTGNAFAADVAFSSKNTIVSSFEGAKSVVAADVDGDGDLDVLGAASGAGTINWWENTAGDGSTWTEHTVDGSFDGATSVFAVDVDGDGDLDVLGAAAFADNIAWFENTAGDGSAWITHTIADSFDGATAVFAADVDGDGDMDVLGAAAIASDISWFENTAGDGSSWIEHTVDGAFDFPGSVFAADIDGDGDMDVLAPATWWENTAGNGSAFSKHIITEARFGIAADLFAADIDGDGDTDVLGAAGVQPPAGQNSGFASVWWENTAGDGSTWTDHIVGTVGASFAADIDGDGDIDVLGALFSSGTIAWWENTAGDGGAWTQHTVNDAIFSSASSVFAADIDGDGDKDVLGAADGSGVGEIAWWENFSDADGDGIENALDNCPAITNSGQQDTDGDGLGNACDEDDDNDGVDDVLDACPLDASDTVDSDKDGTCDNADSDDDNDGAPDAQDAFPLNPAESVDTDSDGMGDNFEGRFGLDINDPVDADLDSDNDGATNLEEFERHRNPRVNEHAVIQGIHPIMF